MTKKYLSFNRETPTQESILIGRKLQTGVYNVGGKELTLIFSIPVRSIKPLLVSLGFENIDNNLQKNISVYSFYEADSNPKCNVTETRFYLKGRSKT